jgi:hypothetical protein
MLSKNIPYLYVNVNAVGKGFNIELSLNEQVTLKRDPKISCRAKTWDMCVTGIHQNNSEYIVTSLSELLDYFLNDYYKANPKK